MPLTRPETYFVTDIRKFADFLVVMERCTAYARSVYQQESSKIEGLAPSLARNEAMLGVLNAINKRVMEYEPIPYVRHDQVTIYERFRTYLNELTILPDITFTDIFRFMLSVYCPNTSMPRVNQLLVEFVDPVTGAVNFSNAFMASYRDLIYAIGHDAHLDIHRVLPTPTMLPVDDNREPSPREEIVAVENGWVINLDYISASAFGISNQVGGEINLLTHEGCSGSPQNKTFFVYVVKQEDSLELLVSENVAISSDEVVGYCMIVTDETRIVGVTPYAGNNLPSYTISAVEA